MDNLKVCPFCGDLPAVYKKEFLDIKLQEQFYIECVSCEKAHINDGWFSKENAIDAWNIRHNENRWVSVKDRLPSLDGKYLLLTQKRHVVAVFYNGHFYKSKAPKRYYKEWLTPDKRYSAVTHWQNLPDAPK